MFKEYIEKLKEYCSKSKGEKVITFSDDLAFTFSNINPLSDEEINAINHLAQNKLPSSYLYYLKEIGNINIFNSEYGNGIDFFDLEGIKNAGKYLNELIPEDEEVEGVKMKGNIFPIGIHGTFGEWMAFDLEESENNFAVLNHEIPTVYYKDDTDWRSFEDWFIRLMKTDGNESL